MQKTACRATLAAVLTVLLAFPQSSWSWGNSGHEAVAYVAWQLLTPQTKARVIALLKQVPSLKGSTGTIAGYNEWVQQLPAGATGDLENEYLFMRAATWPDSIKHEGLHDSDTPPRGVAEDPIVGFTDKASHGYWHFVDAPFASDTTAYPTDTPTPNAATQINVLRQHIASDDSDALKAYEVIWLEHLLGDIHQPLHGSNRYSAGTGDAGGNLVKIKLSPVLEKKFQCPPEPPSKTAPRELHAFWDQLPGSCSAINALAPAAAFGQALPAAPDDKVADTDPNDWAAESLALAKSDAYAAPIGPGVKPSTGTEYVITEDYYDHALLDAQTRVALAGARLAKLLNDNLK